MFSVYEFGNWIVLEPVMLVEVAAPVEFQSAVQGTLHRRNGIVVSQDVTTEFFTVSAEVMSSVQFVLFCFFFGGGAERDEVRMALWNHVCIIVVSMQDPLTPNPPPCPGPPYPDDLTLAHHGMHSLMKRTC